ncbi:MAG: FliG C-terminal domain-containing protein [Mariniblastus sp.]
MNPSSSLMQAAVVVSSLPKKQAAKLLIRLEPADLKSILDAMTRLDDVSAAEVSQSLERLTQETERWSMLDDGAEGNKYSQAKRQLEDALAGAQKSDGKLGVDGPFDFLIDTIPMIRNHLLADEHPQNIAIVLSTLPPEIASQTMKGLDNTQRVSVLKRLCEIEEIRNEDVVELSFALKLRLKRLLNSRKAKSLGVSIASGLLSCSDSETREALLTHVSQTDPDLAVKLQRSVFKLDRLETMEPSTIQVILKHVDTSSWAPALKNASTELQSKILNCMGQRPAELLAHEIDEIGHVTAPVEEIAQQNIVQVVLRLAREGKIDLRSRARESTSNPYSMLEDQTLVSDVTSFIS